MTKDQIRNPEAAGPATIYFAAVSGIAGGACCAHETAYAVGEQRERIPPGESVDEK